MPEIVAAYRIPGPVGRCRATDNGKMALVWILAPPNSSQNIQAMNATHETDDTTSVAIIVALSHLYAWEPACCSAKTRSTEAINKRNAPTTSICASVADIFRFLSVS